MISSAVLLSTCNPQVTCLALLSAEPSFSARITSMALCLCTWHGCSHAARTQALALRVCDVKCARPSRPPRITRAAPRSDALRQLPSWAWLDLAGKLSRCLLSLVPGILRKRLRPTVQSGYSCLKGPPTPEQSSSTLSRIGRGAEPFPEGPGELPAVINRHRRNGYLA